MEPPKQSMSTPIKLGVIIGLVYCALIFCQDQFFYANPLTFSLTKLACYLIILAGFFYTGYTVKKELGGYISFKECLRAILVVIVITEFFYFVFNTIYIKYIDPNFFEKLKTAWIAFFNRSSVPQDKINDTMQKFNDAGKITFGSLVQSYGFSILIDAVFGVIICAILRKDKPVFEQTN